MRTIKGEDFVEIVDLSELWGVERKRLQNIIYRASGWKGSRRFPTPDIGLPTRKAWRYSRLPELNKWWEIYKGGPVTTTHKTDTDKPVETTKEETSMGYTQELHNVPQVPAEPGADYLPQGEPRVIFEGIDITLTLTHEFPAFRDSHVLAIVHRHKDKAEDRKSEKYFITREQAAMIYEMFKP